LIFNLLYKAIWGQILKQGGLMKTGMIFYIAGKKDVREELEQEQFKSQFPSAHLYRFAETEQEVVYYWWELTVKGMHRIFCGIIQADEDMNMHVSDKSLRLFG